MGKTDKEVSKRNEYYIPGERQMELEHFCKQYKMWTKYVQECNSSYIGSIFFNEVKSTNVSDPTFYNVMKIFNYKNNIKLVEQCLKDTFMNEEFTSEAEEKRTKSMLRLNVIEGQSWVEIPRACARTRFYKLRRKFFWILDKFRN